MYRSWRWCNSWRTCRVVWVVGCFAVVVSFFFYNQEEAFVTCARRPAQPRYESFLLRTYATVFVEILYAICSSLDWNVIRFVILRCNIFYSNTCICIIICNKCLSYLQPLFIILLLFKGNLEKHKVSKEVTKPVDQGSNEIIQISMVRIYKNQRYH